MGAVGSYTFSNVTAGHTITAEFTPNAPVYASRTLTHSGTGISVTGMFTDDATLTVAQNKLHGAGTCAACDELRAKQNAGKLLVLYDISASGYNGGEVRVSIPVGSEYNGKTLTVLRCSNGKLEQKVLTVQNGAVSGTFSSLSPYGVLKPTEHDPHSPGTGDDANIGLWIALMLGAALVMGFSIRYRKLRNQ